MADKKNDRMMDEERDGIKSWKTIFLDLLGWGEGGQGWGQVTRIV